MIKLTLALAPLFLVAAGTVALEGGDAAPSALEPIKALAGEWVKVDENGESTDIVGSTYRVTAGGFAVLELVFPGTEHEMVSVYYEQNGVLMMTHYCMLQNAPEMRAKVADGGKHIVFECEGGANVRDDAPHMHRGELWRIADDELRSTWSMYTAGEVGHVEKVHLRRRP